MIDPNKPNWDKGLGLLPAIVQDADDKRILMLGYMNKEALIQTQDTKSVTFFSRSKNRLWVKGETSGNVLKLVSTSLDCDKDTILIAARPAGPVCHTGMKTCFGDNDQNSINFLNTLAEIIKSRRKEMPEGSYTTTLFEQGSKRIAQKVGEEGVEISLAHVSGDKEETLNEAADLVFHMMILLEDAGLSLENVCNILRERHK